MVASRALSLSLSEGLSLSLSLLLALARSRPLSLARSLLHTSGTCCRPNWSRLHEERAVGGSLLGLARVAAPGACAATTLATHAFHGETDEVRGGDGRVVVRQPLQ